jgi:hypothetical protein
MKFHKQEHLYILGDADKRGSCYPTVLACLLDLELDMVPYFHLFYWTEKEKENINKVFSHRYLNDKPFNECEEHQKKNFTHYYSVVLNLWDTVMNQWLASQGYIEKAILNIDEWLKENPETPYMAFGKSARNIGHVVIYKNGKLFHDPHPSNEGLIELDENDFAFRLLEKI